MRWLLACVGSMALVVVVGIAFFAAPVLAIGIAVGAGLILYSRR